MIIIFPLIIKIVLCGCSLHGHFYSLCSRCILPCKAKSPYIQLMILFSKISLTGSCSLTGPRSTCQPIKIPTSHDIVLPFCCELVGKSTNEEVEDLSWNLTSFSFLNINHWTSEFLFPHIKMKLIKSATIKVVVRIQSHMHVNGTYIISKALR